MPFNIIKYLKRTKTTSARLAKRTGSIIRRLKYSFSLQIGNNLDDNSKILATSLQLRSEAISWIDKYYNLNGRHSSYDYLFPIDY